MFGLGDVVRIDGGLYVLVSVRYKEICAVTFSGSRRTDAVTVENWNCLSTAEQAAVSGNKKMEYVGRLTVEGL